MTSVFHSRSRQLAAHLRERIEQGELGGPLPGIRAWCQSLGVGSRTLHIALRMLQREGLLVIHPGKASRIRTRPRFAAGRDGSQRRIVRFLHYGRDYPRLTVLEIPSLAEHLRSRGMEMSLERCSRSRLKAISRAPVSPQEMLVLCSVPAACHRYFARMARNVLIAGDPSPGSPLSSIGSDLEGAVRHATQTLLRRGFPDITLIIDRGSSHGVSMAIEVFHKTCAEWRHQPIHATTVRMRTDTDSMLVAARRFATGVKSRRGILVIEPISVSMIMTALLERGVGIPRQVELVGVSTFADSIKVCPRPIHYPYPVRAAVKSFVDVAIHYFETGALPRIHKKLLMEAVPVASDGG